MARTWPTVLCCFYDITCQTRSEGLSLQQPYSACCPERNRDSAEQEPRGPTSSILSPFSCATKDKSFCCLGFNFSHRKLSEISGKCSSSLPVEVISPLPNTNQCFLDFSTCENHLRRGTREVLSKEKHLSSRSPQCSWGDRTLSQRQHILSDR